MLQESVKQYTRKEVEQNVYAAPGDCRRWLALIMSTLCKQSGKTATQHFNKDKRKIAKL